MVWRACVADDSCMTREDLELLAHVRIASPCPMKWSDMQGDHKKRLCGQCKLHVHKVSELTSAEAVVLALTTLFGDNIRALFGTSGGAGELAGDAHVTRVTPTASPPVPLSTFKAPSSH
jgi:hypothetical protein